MANTAAKSAHALSGKAAVTGVGDTAYSRQSGRSEASLTMAASLAAIRDAGLDPKEIDGIIAYGNLLVTAEDMVTAFGIPDLRFSATTPLGGASAVAGLQAAAAAVATGICRHVLLPLGRNGASGSRIGMRVQQMPQFRTIGEFEMPLGAIAPAQLYAPMARRHMQLYGTRSEHFGEIAVSTRANAVLNGRGMMTKPITLAEHQASRMISDPLRLLDCSLESDGACAVVVSAAAAAKDSPKPQVLILGVGEGHPDSPSAITQRPDLCTFGTAKAAPRAFGMAGVTHADIDVAEVYDCFTFNVLCQLEDLGFCKKGEGGAFVEGGRIRLGGELPINTHGGLLSQAHMAGMNHVVELVRQLRGEAGAAQVKDARIGLVTGYGDMGDGTVAIMARS